MIALPNGTIIGTMAGEFNTAAEARKAIEFAEQLELRLVERRREDSKHILYWEHI